MGRKHPAVTVQQSDPGLSHLPRAGTTRHLQVRLDQVRHCSAAAAVPIGQQAPMGVEGQLPVMIEVPIAGQPALHEQRERPADLRQRA